ncbi:glycosyl hydrolase-related protein [Actinopolymorpha pittospori]
MIVRLYEAFGGRAVAALSASFPLAGVDECDLLENPERQLDLTSDGSAVGLSLRPFQIRTLRLRRGNAASA